MTLLDVIRAPFRTKTAVRAGREAEPLLGWYLPPEQGARPVAIKAGQSVSYNGTSGYTDAPIQASPEGFAYAYTVSTWAYRCVRIRRKAVGRMPWKVINKTTSQVIDDHPLALALNRNRQKLIGKIEFTQVLFGETFIEKYPNIHKQPYGLNWLNNLGMNVDTATGVISAFDYAPVQGGRYVSFQPEQVAFMHTEENPFDDLRGLSPFLVILDELGIDRDVARVVRAFFANDARVGKWMIPKSPMSEPDQERFMAWFKANYQGPKNAGKPVLLSHPVDVTDVQMRPTLDDVQLRESTRREICAALGVPLSIAGAWDDANYQSAPEQRKSLYEETIIPECDDIADFINTDILPYFDSTGRTTFQFDYSEIMALIEDTNDKVTKLNNKLLSGGITLNRYREQIGEKPLPNGEVLYIPNGVTVTPLAKIGQMPAPQAPSPFGGSGGLFQNNPPLVSNPPVARALPPSIQDSPKAIPVRVQKTEDATTEPVKIIEVEAKQTHPLDELAAWEKKALNTNPVKALAFTCYQLSDATQIQIREGLAALPKDAERAVVKAVFASARASIKQEPPDAIPTPPTEEQQYWQHFDRLSAELGSSWLQDYMTRIYERLAPRLGPQTTPADVEAVMTELEPGLAETWIGDADNPGVLSRLALAGMTAANEAVRRDASGAPQTTKALGLAIDWNLLPKDAVLFAQRYFPSLIRGINATTGEAVQKAIADWLQSGQPLDALKEALQAIFQNEARAALIAQTESTRAFAEGSTERYRQLDIEQVKFNTAQDSLVCPICGPLDGQVAGLEQGWMVDGSYRKPPIHPGCRCWMRGVV